MSDERKFFYANAVELTITSFDFNFRFIRKSNIQESGSKGVNDVVASQMTVAEDLVISMSPQHAKILVPLLTNMVNMYESQMGVLPDIKKMEAGIKAG